MAAERPAVAWPTEADGRRRPKSRSLCPGHGVCLAPVYPAASSAAVTNLQAHLKLDWLCFKGSGAVVTNSYSIEPCSARYGVRKEIKWIPQQVLILKVGARRGGPACTMNPWLLVCLVACFAVAWGPTVHAQGAFEDCCLAYHRRARLSLLRHAQSYHRQDVSGSCNLPAVIFFLPQKNKMVCGRPGDRWVRAWMKILDARKNSQYHHGTRRNFQVPHSGVRKLSSGTSTLPLSRFSGPTRNNKRKTSLLSTANPAGP
ncbi:C-C motif chemokine 25 isoform X2 [Bos mutus]